MERVRGAAMEKRMRRSVGLVLLPLLGFSIACGSLYREVQARSFSELSIDLQEWIGLNDPHRAEVQGLIDEGWMAAWEGRVGFFGTVPFEVAFEEYAADGGFDEDEVKALREKAAPFLSGSPSEERRAKLLALKLAMDAEVMVERHQVVRRRRGRLDGEGSSLSDWLLPDDLRDATESAGWELTEPCRNDEIDGIQFVFCVAQKGPRLATVKMDRYPKEEDVAEIVQAPAGANAVRHEGDTILTVAVIDGPAGEALRNAIVANGDKLTKLSASSVQAAIRGGGWELEGCDARKEGSEVTVSCEANQHDRQALVDLVVVRGSKADPKTEERVVSGGEASVHQGRNYLTATVYDQAPANELADAMTD